MQDIWVPNLNRKQIDETRISMYQKSRYVKEIGICKVILYIYLIPIVLNSENSTVVGAVKIVVNFNLIEPVMNSLGKK